MDFSNQIQSHMLRKMKPLTGALFIVFFFFFLSSLPVDNQLTAFHSPEEIKLLNEYRHLYLADTSEFFATVSLCERCHSRDSQNYAQVDTFGNDINVVDDWRASMMANSARDPFWRAKVSHEILVNPTHSEAIETSCTSCHAPLGHARAMFRGAEHYLIDDMLQDTFGLDGVSCGACHHQSAEELGQLNSGEHHWDTSRVIYGPYPFPFEQPMQLRGFTPVYSEHINDAGLCASCHTLIVESLDLDGNPTGSTFVEQATYHEWLNSDYNTQEVSCQACHVPRLNQPVVIADNYGNIPFQMPFGLHEFAGANTMMLQLMKANRDELEIPATAANFDSTLAYTFKMLQKQTLDFALELKAVNRDSLYLQVKLTNKAGHKFPSGYPSRRASIQLVVITDQLDTLFQSGVLDAEYELLGHDPQFEPHYQTINQSDQVQIYQVVNGDVAGQFSTVLERGFQVLKDNRLPPLGFTKGHAVYDTTQIAGAALQDADFNVENGQEGSGTDRVNYHVALQGYEGGHVQVYARVWYQSLPPKWMEEMFAATSPEIERFREMYQQADRAPVAVASDTLANIYIEPTGLASLPMLGDLRLFPNPSADGWMTLAGVAAEELGVIEVYTVEGKWRGAFKERRFLLPEQAGVYLVKVITSRGWQAFKVLRN